MRHRKSGRKLNRNASHRKAMFRNMACGLLHTLRETGEGTGGAKVSGRIVTTITKAKELRGYVERLVTFAKRAAKHADAATQFSTSAARGSAEWIEWRKSDRWRSWAKAVAPAIALRRRAFSVLRDREAVRLLFDVVEPQCRERNGGYTRVLRLAEFRLGDGGRKAIFEFVGFNGVEKARKFTPAVS